MSDLDRLAEMVAQGDLPNGPCAPRPGPWRRAMLALAPELIAVARRACQPQAHGDPDARRPYCRICMGLSPAHGPYCPVPALDAKLSEVLPEVDDE